MSVVNEERNYTVYMHVNKMDRKRYVGITKQEVKRRWLNGKGYKKIHIFIVQFKNMDGMRGLNI